MKTRWYCLFCDQWDRIKRARERPIINISGTLSYNRMPDKYAERQDEWECRGQGILSFVSDLYSSDTVYHR